TRDTHTAVINWGDGTSSTVNIAAGVLTFSASHTYKDNPAGQPNGSFSIGVTLTDKDGGSTTASGNVQVKNLAPAAQIGGTYLGTAALPVALQGAGSDPSPV